MSSIMRRRRGLKSAISILLSEGGLQHPHPLSQEAIYATLPLTPRQRLRSIHPTQFLRNVLYPPRWMQRSGPAERAYFMHKLPQSTEGFAGGEASCRRFIIRSRSRTAKSRARIFRATSGVTDM